MKNSASSMSGHDSISIPDSVPISETNELAIHANVKTHEEIPEENNNTVARKSKRQRVTKSFGEDFIIYLMDNTHTTIAEAYSSLDADL
jgi:hypothetical protein